MFLGHSPQLNATMWYQVDLIYLTLLFLAVILIFQKNYETVLMILGFLALAAQYSGINLIFDNLRFELKYPLGGSPKCYQLLLVDLSFHPIKYWKN